MALPLSVVIDELKEPPSSLVPILSAIHHANCQAELTSGSRLKHLTSRAINLCKLPTAHGVWCGVNVLYVLIDNSEALAAEGLAMFAALFKVMNSSLASDIKVFSSAVKCLDKLCNTIRGKPTLTREVLTPNLSGVFTVLLQNMDSHPQLVLPSLQTLIQEHPTTSRPFANKLKTKLLDLVAQDDFAAMSAPLRRTVCATLACLPIIEKDGPENFWLKDTNRIISNLADTLDVFSNFLMFLEDEELVNTIKTLRALEDPIFASLVIDVNHSTTILTIAQRYEVLLQLLEGYVVSGTKFTVHVPIGKVLALLEALLAVNTLFMSFRREVRDAETKEFVELALHRCHIAALSLLQALPELYSGSLLAHLNSMLGLLELLIFLKNKRLDRSRILGDEQFITQILCATTNWLSITFKYPDYSAVARIAEAALVLMEPKTQPQKAPAGSASNGKSKAQKRKITKNYESMADLYSHAHLFQKTVSDHTRAATIEFFVSLITKVPIAATQYNKFLRFVVIEAVRAVGASHHNLVPKDIEKALVVALLNPTPEAASILPIAMSLLPTLDVLNVFSNPRFPPLPVILKPTTDTVSSDEDEEPVAIQEKPKKRAKLQDATLPTSKKTEVLSTDIFVSKPEAVDSTANQSLESNLTELVVKTTEVVTEETIVVMPIENSEPASKTDEEEDNLDLDSGSEIEIPDLDLDEDSENE